MSDINHWVTIWIIIFWKFTVFKYSISIINFKHKDLVKKLSWFVIFKSLLIILQTRDFLSRLEQVFIET